MHDTPLRLFREAIKDRYSIEREIGRGAYGTVFLAQDLVLQRRVALKVLHAGLLQGVDRARLLHEFRVVARLNHPHILPVYDIGLAHLVYYVTPFVEHVSLRERIKHGPLALSEALQIAQDIADALTYAHGHGVVHRDIKPENVFLVEGKALVKDFWIARTLSRAALEKSTKLVFVIGTPGYMSPEQARGVPQPDPRSDVYSLAALICEMLTRELPFAGSATDMFGQLSRDPSIEDLPRSLPPRLASVLTKALAREPSDRFATPRELMEKCLAAEERLSTSLFSASLTSLEKLSPVGSSPGKFTTVLGTRDTGEPVTGSGTKVGRSTFTAAQAVTRGARAAQWHLIRDLFTRKRLPALVAVLIVLVGASIVGITTSFPTLSAPLSLAVYLFLSIALAVSVGALLRRKITGLQTAKVDTTDAQTTDVRPVVRFAPARSDPAARLRSALQYRYDVIRELGRGGMAVVYFAHDLRYRRPREVALKVLRPEYALVIGSERFIEEIEIMAELSHPDILTILDFGDVDGMPFYVMPYVRGESLKAYLDREGAVPVTFAISVAESVARALDYAHRHNKVHRDIKPENILLHEGRALLADFGIALALDRADERLTKPDMSLGTPEFMSPEQFWDPLHVDGRSDVYSLGCVVYEMLAGAPPYTGTRQQLSLKHRDDPIPHIRAKRGEVPEPADNAICKALAKSRNDRFETAGSFMDALTSRGTPFAIA